MFKHATEVPGGLLDVLAQQLVELKREDWGSGSGEKHFTIGLIQEKHR